MSELGPASVEQIITSCQHALTQVESLQLGCTMRSERIQHAKTDLDNIYGTDVGRTVALACAHGAEADVSHALRKAMDALREEIGHLQEARPS